jgi:PhnB protein
MKRLDLYLHFTGECRAAMEFYHQCLGGELTLSTFGESPMATQVPAALKDQIIQSRLEAEGVAIVADDVTGRVKIAQGNNISLFLHSGHMKEIEGYFSKLSEGGQVHQPLTQAFFGIFGMFTDKFGLNWVFQADNP